MSLKHRQNGFSAVELLLLVLVVAALVGVGYMFYNQQQDSSSSPTTTQPTASDVSQAPQIKDAADLDKALNVLDQNDPGSGSDSAQLVSQLSTF